ncbi:MAG: sarcosine oxidase subunit gamma family protein [Chloroflexota bacterium]
MTTFTPIFRSPIAAPPVADDADGLRLLDLTGASVTLITGDADAVVAKALSADLPAKPGDLVNLSDSILARLTPKELYLFGLSADGDMSTTANLVEAIQKAKSNAVATDYTHGKAIMKLVGRDATGLLSKICGLNFQNDAFPNLQVKQTSAAKVKTLIARVDDEAEPAYYLQVNRPLGQYFWEVAWDAGQEFGIR